MEEDLILGNLVRAIEILESSECFAMLIPEVRSNLVYAKRNARSVDDVAGIKGRITRIGRRAKACGYPAFGASDHMARLIILIMKHEPGYRAGINFMWSEELSNFLEGYAGERGWIYSWIDRSKEPEEVARVEGASMGWKVEQLIEGCGRIPKLFYESAGIGKEPLFVLLGRDAVEVAEQVVEIAGEWAKRVSIGWTNNRLKSFDA